MARMAIFFDGKAHAEEKLVKLAKKVSENGVRPKLVSIIVGENPVGRFYANLKKVKAESIGITIDILEVVGDASPPVLVQEIDKLNNAKDVDGIMLQLPLSKSFSWRETQNVLNAIDPKKDVDGLGEKSAYLAPTVKSVMTVVSEAQKFLSATKKRVVVVGFTGFEGSSIYKTLKPRGYLVEGANTKTRDLKKITLTADMLISATGVADLVKDNMVKPGAVLIDVGSPKGDIAKEAYDKAGFVSPVPGGVGPVTICELFDNLITAALTYKY